jgi:hypothetical protein
MECCLRDDPRVYEVWPSYKTVFIAISEEFRVFQSKFRTSAGERE